MKLKLKTSWSLVWTQLQTRTRRIELLFLLIGMDIVPRGSPEDSLSKHRKERILAEGKQNRTNVKESNNGRKRSSSLFTFPGLYGFVQRRFTRNGYVRDYLIIQL